ncbi:MULTISPECIES: hypothetical protein [Mycolicibacterium]|uniref:Uncharacterized protein n=1 Tax=Mycolicibacterium fortuitum TaxID=1766 RepID=A0ABD6QD97_MYCFO|nr:hypothetical protein [Mycolicibacterium fortuitum]MCA4726230.1 hypothetical protein [Mycolicibacterium fortuitum]NOP95587.1 hypothetical protein [Mycolicibacterium fortuitum]NOR01960.1 hypothetical protein [Mycolicibacterium fortuitum]OBB03452.1 hypothetical protein A5665_15345 [Mycolicibacterium fortuitum]OBI62881.1 hypothetical protein A5667_07710 [Mycolicibacterium fortuitum]
MTVPVHDDFTVPVVLQGADSTRVWRGRGQTLTMSPAGITFERRGKTVQLEWRDITGIDMVNMSGSFRIVFNAWAICARDVDAIYPHEFEKDWPTGQIGRWLAHYRPDLVLPADGAMLPFGIPREYYRWVIPFALVAGLVGSFIAAKSFLGGLGIMAAMVVLTFPFTSPRRFRIAGGIFITVMLAWLLVVGFLALVPINGKML